MNARVNVTSYRLGATIFFGFATDRWYFTVKFWRHLHMASAYLVFAVQSVRASA